MTKRMVRPAQKTKRTVRPRARIPRPAAPSPAQAAASVNAGVLGRMDRLNEAKVARDTVDLFRAYRPLPGIVPKDVKLAMDDASMSSEFANWTAFGQWGAEEGQQFLGFPLLATLAQRAEYRLVAETFATEATRNWIVFKSASGKDKSEKIKAIEKEVARLDLKDKARKASEHDSYFGRGHWFMDFGAIEGPEIATDIGDGLSAVSKSKVGKENKLRDVRVIEPIWVYPQIYNATNPMAPDFYKPPSWFVFMQPVDKSRLLTFVSREVPDLLKSAYAFSGLSMTQMLRPYVDNWLDTRQAVTALVKSFSTFVLSTNMGDIISGGSSSGDGFVTRLQFFASARNNLGVMAIDKTKEDFKNVSVPLGGLDGIQAQALEHLSAISQIPLVKLTGISPSGLNASGDQEMRCWEDRVLAYQESFFRPRFAPVFNFVQLSLFGDVDEDIVFEFVPLLELTEHEEAELRKIDADTGAVLISAKVISTEEERGRVSSNLDGPYHGLEAEKEIEFPLTETEKAGIAASISTAAATLASEGLITPRTALEEIRKSSEITGFGALITDEDIAEAEAAAPKPGEGDPNDPANPDAGGEGGETISQSGGVHGQAAPAVTAGVQAVT